MKAEPKWMQGKALLVLEAVITIGFLGGCATNTVHEMNAMQQNISMLRERVEAMERRIEGFDGQSQKKADLYARLQELQLKVGALNGRIDEADRKIEQMARSAASASSPQATTAAAATPSITVVPTVPPPTTTAAQASTAKPPPAVQPPQPTIAVPEKDPEKELFDKASQSFQQGQYDAARKDFQSFVSKYPKSQQAESALYSVGECYFSEKRYQDAVEVYQQVIERYPKGGKVPQALFKQGTAFQQMGDTTAARILYERVVEKYPESPQGQAAQKKLKQLQ
ncbi:MAG TPA: tol-pal system protein YbgF [Syntrophobacteraceae bacterium]|nr:tol-pal system protein YbgF [Syntrophobacteraceae bacterium]